MVLNVCAARSVSATNMLFNPAGILASTTPSVTSLMSYTLSPIVQIGFVMVVSVSVVLIAYTWIIRRGVRGAVRSISK